MRCEAPRTHFLFGLRLRGCAVAEPIEQAEGRGFVPSRDHGAGFDVELAALSGPLRRRPSLFCNSGLRIDEGRFLLVAHDLVVVVFVVEGVILLNDVLATRAIECTVYLLS